MRVDSVPVRRVLTPSSTAVLAQMMREESGALAPLGAGTQLTMGNPLGPIDAAVETRRLDRITEYVASDLTIHVEAGVTLGQLDTALGKQGQMLPLDPWTEPGATIGGIVATNSQGPLRAVGTVRDWIIGMRVVHPGGRESKTGGRVVKNVSGYDLAKLYTGSLGSLAVISEVSFKVRAAYETTATARLHTGTVEAAAEIVRLIRSGPTEPISLVWCGPRNDVVVRFGEHPRAVRWQLDRLPPGDWERFDRDVESGVWADVREHYTTLDEPLLRVSVLPSEVGVVLDRFRPSTWLAHGVNGTILMTVAAEGISRLRKEFPAVIERASLAVRQRVPTFGVQGAEYDLMRKVKTAFDPEGRLNPGRHIDGERPE